MVTDIRGSRAAESAPENDPPDMKITHLNMHNFRNAAKRRYEFAASRVLLLGPNGVGKSNILEALGFLSVLRSFRGAPVREMVRLDEHEFILSARLEGGGHRKLISLRERVGGARELFEDKHPVPRSSDFIRNFRTVVFAPEDRMIVAGGAANRRRFFDMLISVLEPKYFAALGSCNRVLKQRNCALRAGGKGAEFFVPVLVESASVLTAFRREYAALLEVEVNRLLADRGRFAVKCRFSAPSDPEEFRRLLIRERDRELRRGATLCGPHLDDFEFTLDGRPLRSCGSNGQIRLVALYLKLAEFALVRRLAELPVLVLADDVTGELDADNTRRFFELTQVADQAFFTFTRRPDDSFFAGAQEIVLETADGIPSAG